MLGEGVVLLILWSLWFRDPRKEKHMIATISSINAIYALVHSSGEVIGSLSLDQGTRGSWRRRGDWLRTAYRCGTYVA
jgi:hypothetical protein